MHVFHSIFATRFFFLQVRGPIPIQLGTDVLPSIKTLSKSLEKY